MQILIPNLWIRKGGIFSLFLTTLPDLESCDQRNLRKSFFRPKLYSCSTVRPTPCVIEDNNKFNQNTNYLTFTNLNFKNIIKIRNHLSDIFTIFVSLF